MNNYSPNALHGWWKMILFPSVLLSGCSIAPAENIPVIYASPPARHGDDDANYRFERYVLTPKSTWGHNEAAQFLTDLQNSQTLEIKWNSPATLLVASPDRTTVKCNAANASRQAVGDSFFLENYGVTLETLELVSYKASAKPNLSLTTTDCHAQGFGHFIKAYGGWNVVLPVNGVLFIGVHH